MRGLFRTKLPRGVGRASLGQGAVRRKVMARGRAPKSMKNPFCSFAARCVAAAMRSKNAARWSVSAAAASVANPARVEKLFEKSARSSSSAGQATTTSLTYILIKSFLTMRNAAVPSLLCARTTPATSSVSLPRRHTLRPSRRTAAIRHRNLIAATSSSACSRRRTRTRSS